MLLFSDPTDATAMVYEIYNEKSVLSKDFFLRKLFCFVASMVSDEFGRPVLSQFGAVFSGGGGDRECAGDARAGQ